MFERWANRKQPMKTTAQGQWTGGRKAKECDVTGAWEGRGFRKEEAVVLNGHKPRTGKYSLDWLVIDLGGPEQGQFQQHDHHGRRPCFKPRMGG